MRKYYILFYWTDYEGYDLHQIYMGDNYEAIKDRYESLRWYFRQRFFIDENTPEEDIDDSFYPLPKKMEIGEEKYSYMNDNGDYYLTYGVKCIGKNNCVDQNIETWYKEHCPKANK